MTRARAKQTWVAKINGEPRTVRVIVGPDCFGIVMARVMDTDGKYVVQAIRLHGDHLIMQVPDAVT